MEISEALTVVGGRTEVGPTKTYARRSVGIPRSIIDELAAHISPSDRALGRPLRPRRLRFHGPSRRTSATRPALQADPPAGDRRCGPAAEPAVARPQDTRVRRSSSSWARTRRRSRSAWVTARSRSPWMCTAISSLPSTRHSPSAWTRCSGRPGRRRVARRRSCPVRAEARRGVISAAFGIMDNGQASHDGGGRRGSPWGRPCRGASDRALAGRSRRTGAPPALRGARPSVVDEVWARNAGQA